MLVNDLFYFSSVLQCKWFFSGQLDSGKQHLPSIRHDHSSIAEPKWAVLGVRITHSYKQAHIHTLVILLWLYSQMSLLLSRVALQRSSGLDETGPVVWHLALCLLLSSMIVAAALIRGIKSSGKVRQQPQQSKVGANAYMKPTAKIKQSFLSEGFPAIQSKQISHLARWWKNVIHAQLPWYSTGSILTTICIYSFLVEN